MWSGRATCRRSNSTATKSWPRCARGSERTRAAALAGLLWAALGAAAAHADTYGWDNLPIGGGGYVTGLVAHPTEPNLLYARTDVGGAYRLGDSGDQPGRVWIPITDAFPNEEWNAYGIESLVLDPADPDRVYIAAGKYDWAGPGRVFASDDRGRTWRPLGLQTPMRGNGRYRWAGERLAVDPKDGAALYFASRTEGLFLSDDRGATWRAAGLAETGAEDVGIVFALPDPGAGTPTRSRLFAGAFGRGVFMSDDGGVTWSDIGGPKEPVRAALAGRTLLVTATDGVFRYQDGVWIDSSPFAGHEFGAIAVDPRNPDFVAVGERRSDPKLPYYLSRDGGRTWFDFSPGKDRVSWRSDVPWWPEYYFAAATSALVFDPAVANRLWLSDWYGVWTSFDADKRTMSWRGRNRGLEVTVAATLSTPPEGAALFAGVYDNVGFRFEDTRRHPAEQLAPVGDWNTVSIDFHESDPDRVVRVGTHTRHGDGAGGAGGVSLDNGRSWTGFNWPFGAASRIAYSATDPERFVALPLNGLPKVSETLGRTWLDSDGVETPPIDDYWNWSQPLAADRVDGSFYLYADGAFHRSDDGRRWTRTADLPKRGDAQVEAMPGAAGHVWVALSGHGLHTSRDGGRSFQRLPGVARAHLFSFGKPAFGSDRATIFLYGRLDGDAADKIYRSLDLGLTWEEIGSAAQPIGNQPNTMRGCRQSFGRVFIGTNGRGVFVGALRREEPERATAAGSAP